MVDKEIYRDIISGTNIVSGTEYRDIMCTISQLASDMVVKTLGPYGATTMLDTGVGFTYPTKDGWSALNKLKFNDPIYNTAFNLLKQISFNSVNSVGDSTTTAMVAANAFLQAVMGFDLESKPKFDQALFRKRMEEIRDTVIGHLYEKSKKIPDGDEGVRIIKQIAYIATNGNQRVADMIGEIFEKTSNLNIHVQMDDSDDIGYTIETGYKMEAAMLNYAAYINSDGARYVGHNIKIALFDHSINYVDHKDIITSLSQYAAKINTTILIMAPYFDDTISRQMSLLVDDMMRNRIVPNIAIIQIPVTTELQKTSLKDLAVITNASIFDGTKVKIFNTMVYNAAHADDKMDESIFDADPIKYEYPEEVLSKALGNIRTIEMTKNEAFIRDYDDIVNPTSYQAILDEADKAFKDAQIKANKLMNGTMDKDYMNAHMRYVKLLGKTGVIKVGGSSDVQKKCDKDGIDDAVLVCRSAWSQGYIRGMCLDTLEILSNIVPGDDYSAYAIRALCTAFETVAMAVLNNKCGPEVVQDTTYGDQTFQQTNYEILCKCIDDGLCYDVRTNTYYDEKDYPIINSLAADVQVLKATVGVLTMVITSNQFLSMTKQYDRKMSKKQSLIDAAVQERLKGAAFAQGIINTLKKAENRKILADILSDILPTMSMADLPFYMGEDEETLDPEEDSDEEDTENPILPDNTPFPTYDEGFRNYSGYTEDLY